MIRSISEFGDELHFRTAAEELGNGTEPLVKRIIVERGHFDPESGTWVRQIGGHFDPQRNEWVLPMSDARLN